MSTQQFSFCYSRSTFDITESKLDLFHLTKQFYRNCISLWATVSISNVPDNEIITCIL